MYKKKEKRKKEKSNLYHTVDSFDDNTYAGKEL